MEEGAMEKDQLKVVILYNLLERLQKGEEKDILAEEAIIEEIEAVERSVRSLGYQCFVLSLNDEVLSVIHWLREIRPDVVVNLCESVYGNSSMEMNIPALGPSEHFLHGFSSFDHWIVPEQREVKDILLSEDSGPLGIRSSSLQACLRTSLPLIVKTPSMRRSLGITRDSVVFDEKGLTRQIEYVTKVYGQPALVEEFIDGREINVGMIEFNGRVEPLPISEIDYSGFPADIPKICGYEAKWITESVEYKESKPVCPAPVTIELKKRLETVAVEVYRLFECRDYARVDMRVDQEENIYILEVNPNPDISPQSGMARAIKVRGMTYADFVGGMVQKALERRVGVHLP
jgi:D-alanine-D-alanine ligase